MNIKELLIYHCGCHGIIVTIATEYVTDAYHPVCVPNLNSIGLKILSTQPFLLCTRHIFLCKNSHFSLEISISDENMFFTFSILTKR